MKIAFVTFEYPPFVMGGSGVYAKYITEELVKLGYQITVFTPNIYNTNNEIPTDNLEIIRIKINRKLPFKALQFWLNLHKEIKNAEMKKKFDIFHLNGISYFSLKKKIFEAPQITMVHHSVRDTIKTNKMNYITKFLNIGSEYSFIMPMIEKKLINSSQEIVVPSEFTKNRILKHYKVDPSIIQVIYEGINLNNSKTSSSKKINVNKWAGKNVILFVGRIDDYRKGLDILLKIFKRVLYENDCQLIVVGSGNRKNMISIAKSLDILNKVFFTGHVDENALHEYYNLCDVYVCPSRLEGFGFTLLEAIAVGKPVVAFKVGSIPELVKNYHNGILIDENNIDAFAGAICYLLNNGKLEWTIKERINYLKENFVWENSAKELSKIYSKWCLNE